MTNRRIGVVLALLILGSGCSVSRQVAKQRSTYQKLLKACEELLLPNSMARPTGFDISAHLEAREQERKKLAMSFANESGTQFLQHQLSEASDELERLCIAKALFDIAAGRGR